MPVLTAEKQGTIVYNGMTFTLTEGAKGWDIAYPKGTVGTGLFPGVDAVTALAKAKDVIRSAFPVGVRVVGPDINHPARVGDLKLVPPDVGHPNFIHWDKGCVL